MPREIYPSSYECDCGHVLNFFENTIREMREVSRRKRAGIGEGSDRHAAIFHRGEWVAIYCPKAGAEISARPASSQPEIAAPDKPRFTQRQGQVLAFIHTYAKLNRRPPAEADIAAYFRITAPSAHGMVKKLTQAGLIERQPGQPRSIRLLIPPAELPALG